VEENGKARHGQRWHERVPVDRLKKTWIENRSTNNDFPGLLKPGLEKQN
jgi:hypothetical protein